MKKFGATWLTLAVLAALAVFYFQVEIPKEKEAREEKDRSTRIVDFTFHDVTEFEYRHGDLHIQAKKEDMLWHLLKPLEVIGDGREIAMFLAQLEDARILRVVDEAPASLADFGLDSPEVSLRVTLKDGRQYAALIGNPAPIGHSLYMKLESEKRVLMIAGFPEGWHRDLYKLRSKNIVDYDTPAITEVDLVRPDGTLHLKKENDVWTLSGIAQGKGDRAAIEDLLNGIRLGRIQAFDAETPESLKPYALENPKRRYIARAGDQTWELHVGKAADDKTFHARRTTADNVFRIEKRLVDLIDSNPLDLIDRHVAAMDPADITALEIQDGEESARLVRDANNPEQWRMESPVQDVADSAVVQNLLFDLKDIQAKHFMKFGAPDSFGLKTPRKTLTLVLKDGSEHSLRLGNANLDGTEVYVSRSGDDATFVLDMDSADKLFRAPHLFRQRTLLRFNPKKIIRIEIKSADKVFELIREEERWKLTRPEALSPLKPFIGNDVLWTLSHLEFEKEIDPAQTGTAFKSPEMEIALFTAEGKDAVRLTIGDAVEDSRLRFARVGGRKKPVQIRDRILSEIPHSLEKFRLALESEG